MTHLNIQQGLNIEVVSTNLIKKLYEAALSVPKPLEGELDAAYMSGNLLVDKSYRALVEYLTNRFDDLHINVTGDYYIEFEDPEVLSVLLANNFSSDGVGITESDAASAYLLTKFANNSNITTFNEFKYFTSVNKTDTGSAQTFINCTNLSEIDLTEWEVALLRLFENTAITTVNAPKLSRYGSAWGATGVFQTNSHLTTVQSLGHITKIVSSMFSNCINLETVNLPQECTTISENAFLIDYNQGGGNLTTINLDNITTVESRAFQELRRLAKVFPTDMPSLTSVGVCAFQNCVALTGSINYQNLTSIGSEAFANCSGLNGTINLPNLTSLGSNAFLNTSITSIADLGSIIEIPGDCFNNCRSLTTVTLPLTCVAVKNGAFYNSTITSIDLSNVTSILNVAFKQCASLTTIGSFNLNLTSLPNLCFKECTNLVIDASILPTALRSFDESFTFYRTKIYGTLNLPNLISAGHHTFAETNISSVTDLGSITTIPNAFLENCTNLTSVVIPNTVTSIGEYSFNGDSSLSSINIPSNVTVIGLCAFLNCRSLTSVTLPSNCTSIGNLAFNGCSGITNIDLSNITSLGYNAFRGTSCVKLSFPKLTSIVNECFSGWPSPLTTVEFGDLLLSIGSLPFWGSLIKTFIFHSTTVPSYSDPYDRNFLYNMTGVTIYVPDASLNDYKTTGLWANMANNIKGLSELPS